MVSQLCLMCGSTYNCQTLCLGARLRYSLVVDEDVKKQTNKQALFSSASLSLYPYLLSPSIAICHPLSSLFSPPPSLTSFSLSLSSSLSPSPSLSLSLCLYIPNHLSPGLVPSLSLSPFSSRFLSIHALSLSL